MDELLRKVYRRNFLTDDERALLKLLKIHNDGGIV